MRKVKHNNSSLKAGYDCKNITVAYKVKSPTKIRVQTYSKTNRVIEFMKNFIVVGGVFAMIGLAVGLPQILVH